MPFTKEQLKAYYEVNRLKLNQQRTERRRLARLGQINNSEVETSDRLGQVETFPDKFKVETIPNLGIGLRQVETLDNLNQVETGRLGQVETLPKVETVVDHVQPKEKVVDLEAYNAEVYKRASFLTKDPKAFFTFPDGRKIIRTKCGCNPTKDFYDWCLDSCEYFIGWRNKAILNHE